MMTYLYCVMLVTNALFCLHHQRFLLYFAYYYVGILTSESLKLCWLSGVSEGAGRAPDTT